jgi:hypothetical protein
VLHLSCCKWVRRWVEKAAAGRHGQLKSLTPLQKFQCDAGMHGQPDGGHEIRNLTKVGVPTLPYARGRGKGYDIILRHRFSLFMSSRPCPPSVSECHLRFNPLRYAPGNFPRD